ncbi:TrbI/VirB10 family protein [Mesorhizobium sp. M1E.F.Ca.ET.063.01.1.1]|uniref:TrbI/VirB10 family protein n=1 Tax=Mesorhizobium sp. M1E.F.Ca.ET.063.01.1.1 TaxID=2496750 RepID=UPI001FE22145|nr:TrbI/VirB10 family protein [Mesorhizobium sp. M1E.F.Ca.ET.063.01.1.1]
MTGLAFCGSAAGLGEANVNPNGQRGKEDPHKTDPKELGYLPNRFVPQQSPYEPKRGSVITATHVAGINSDLPGRITAQVSQNVDDSATGDYLLTPRRTKLFGSYDSKVSIDQSHILRRHLRRCLRSRSAAWGADAAG